MGGRKTSGVFMSSFLGDRAEGMTREDGLKTFQR